MVVAAAAAVLAFRGRDKDVRYADDRRSTAATSWTWWAPRATLQAVTTVQVGSQVSGTIDSLDADFNSQVKKGQVLARLDPSLFEARAGAGPGQPRRRRGQRRAARGPTVEDAQQKYERAQELSAEQLLPAADLETAKRQLRGGGGAACKAQPGRGDPGRGRRAARRRSTSTHTVIRAPIDGVVVARNVDVGQTVAASLQAPVLFVIANDLSQHAGERLHRRGRRRPRARGPGRAPSAWTPIPTETFTGRVEQVRLQPITVQNVVTYNTHHRASTTRASA